MLITCGDFDLQKERHNEIYHRTSCTNFGVRSHRAYLEKHPTLNALIWTEKNFVGRRFKCFSSRKFQ
jgi:hypothetical protein